MGTGGGQPMGRAPAHRSGDFPLSILVRWVWESPPHQLAPGHLHAAIPQRGQPFADPRSGPLLGPHSVAEPRRPPPPLSQRNEIMAEPGPRCTRRKQANPRRKNVDPEKMPEEVDVDHLGPRDPRPGTPASETKEALPPTSMDCLPEDGLVSSASPVPPTDDPPAVNGHRGREERTNGMVKEQTRIRQFLNRNDTAVVFPRPVDVDRDRKEVAETLGTLLKCPHCDLVLAGHSSIAEHVEAVHGPFRAESTHRCNKCNAVFTLRDHLEKHAVVHSSNVQRHMISHDESTVLRKFKCPECGKAFKFKHHLKEHIRIHSGEKPFACPNCGKRFSHSGSYSSHMTSKKCLVMNLKVKKLESKSSRGRSSQPNNSFRPIIPKYDGGGNGRDSTPPTSTYLSTSERFQNYDFQNQPPVVQSFLPSSYYQPLTSVNYSTSSFVRMTTYPDLGQVVQGPESDSGLEAQEANQDMKAVKKILEIVGATVSKQKQEASNGVSEQSVGKSEASEDGGDKCKHCEERFDSRLEQVHHERYLCRNNPDSSLEEGRCEEATEEEDEAAGKDQADGILNEETLQILKDYYNANPWRKEFEVSRIAQELGCSSQLVEFWFQSMRTRDKSLNCRSEPIHVPKYKPQTPLRTSPYTPVVPHYNGAIPLQWYSQRQHRETGDTLPLQCLTTISVFNEPYTADDNEQPLDLSMKGGHREFQVLNLSQKSKDSSDGETSSQQGSASPRNVETSPLYKYVQQRGSLLSGTCATSLSPKSQDEDHSSTVQSASFSLSPFGGDGGRRSSSSDTGSTGETVLEDTDGETGSPKLKRIRKKTWKQMEAEESHSAVEDSAEGEEESGGKRRKSWKQHRLESEEGMYGCDQCDKMFSKQSSLARHKYEHSGQRPHKCDVCNKAFKHKHHLTEHKRLHSGEKPFQCKKCFKRFSHSGSYSQHMNHRYSYCKPYRQ
ncbi:zinc finger E-box-binding homeobox protein zag-1-like isoform X2 [Centruroides sculpturatus]|uniref:zinc finger E-box-binding homeobox protein zag-1-like isoform X2 n=1 Tax=Centruroides sculpturatus TaxID=218467 RepID=UPI000C6D8018|nr:zinc finger E-box-binding homeobox protein zag-1-like isoform X2 [Centruroides sculpturatus]